MHNPQDSQDIQKQKILEKKLKTHIQREFSLGEKVISLLKQKKQLEESLVEQQEAQTKLENDLEVMLKSKKTVERKFLQTQKTLQEKQHKLKTRSRIIIEDEENSRETLERLHQKIEILQGQLNTVDTQKIEEKKRLIQNLQKLRQKEKFQRQKLQKIVEQRDTTEKRLRSVVKKYKQLSRKYHHGKNQHEQQLETLYKEQINREARIELLRDEKHINEENLLKEIESLKQAKAELEEKLKQVEKQDSSTSWAFDSDLVQVIEKQNQYIQELKEKARKRSTILKTENETLRKEMESMLNDQEKAKWENQMLESSLKGLQTDLAEYMQLKNKFEEVQKEKEDFEKLFQRRLQFFDDRDSETHPTQVISAESPSEELIKQKEGTQELQKTRREKTDKHFFKRLFPTKNRLMEWLNISKPRLLNAFLVILVIAIAIAIYHLIPWRYMWPMKVSRTQEAILEPLELPVVNTWESEGTLSPERQPVKKSQPAKSPRLLAAKPPTKQPEKTSLPPKVPVAKSSSREKRTKLASQIPPAPPPAKKLKGGSVRAGNIVVQLSPTQAKRFLSQEKDPFPTIENNSILRRHHQQKFAAAHY